MPTCGGCVRMSKSKIVHPYGRGGWRISGMEQAAVKTQLHGVPEVYLRPPDSEMLLESRCPHPRANVFVEMGVHTIRI